MKCDKEKRLSYIAQAKEIVEKLTLEEKVSLMSGKMDFKEVRAAITKNSDQHYNSFPYPAGGLPEYNVPEMKFCDGPRGVVCGTGLSTCLPVTMCRGASFDAELEEKIGRMIGQEVLAYKGNTFAGVCVNLPYNPGWGRSQETYGEESFHLGEMGAALVRGVQEEGVIACVKHFAFNQMEISRFDVNITCSKRTEREVFLPHFKKCIDAGAGAVMSSYNLFNGYYCGHSDYLLNRVLKSEWDFDGFVMSDFVWGVKDTVEAANGGMDIEMCCTKYFGDKLVEAVKEGKVSEEKIDESALRIIRTLIAFQNYQTEVPEDVLGCQEHIKLALQSAREGITLLKNDNGILPFNKKEIKKLVLLGRLANARNIGDGGSSEVYSKYVVTPMEGLANVNPSAQVICYDGPDIAHAIRLAKDADAVVVVVGYDHDDEGEFVSKSKEDAYTSSAGGDRTEALGLKKEDIKLLKEAAAVNENTAAVLIGGNMIMIEEWKKDVPAIVMAYYPGMEGGTALAEILYGDVNPSGKLPFVIPRDENDLPQVTWETKEQYYEYYHGYARLEKNRTAPSLPYGYGLSYTTFEINNGTFSTDGKVITGKCKVKNTGLKEGDEVIQLYVGFKNSRLDRPVKLLRGFQRVSLYPGQEKQVSIKCPVEELCFYNEKLGTLELEHMEYEVYIGNSSSDTALLKGSVTI